MNNHELLPKEFKRTYQANTISMNVAFEKLLRDGETRFV